MAPSGMRREKALASASIAMISMRRVSVGVQMQCYHRVTMVNMIVAMYVKVDSGIRMIRAVDMRVIMSARCVCVNTYCGSVAVAIGVVGVVGGSRVGVIPVRFVRMSIGV